MTDHRVMLPLRPNWASGVELNLRHRTDMFVSDAGLETRRALRSRPRIDLAFRSMMHAKQVETLNRILATSQNMECILANPTRLCRLDASALSGATALTLGESAPFWLADDTELVLTDGETFELVEVTSVNGANLTVAALLNNWPSGTKVYQALTGRLTDSVGSQLVTDNLIQTDVQFNVQPQFNYRYADLPVMEGFAGRDILPIRPDWGADYGLQNEWPTKKVDMGYGVISHYDAIDFPSPVYSLQARCFDASEIERDLALFQSLRGQCRHFYMPTGVQDFDASSVTAVASDGLTIAGRWLYDSYRDHPIYNILSVRANDGSVYRRPISGLALSPDNASSVVSVAPDWGGTLAAAGVAEVSWLLKARSATDIMSVKFATDTVAEHKFSFRGLPGDGYDSYIQLRTTPEDVDREVPAGDDRAVIYL